MPQNNQALDLAEALAQINAQLAPVQTQEQIALAAAHNRVLAEDVFAPINLPPFRASAMDGYAIRRTDLTNINQHGFELVGTSLAGHPSATTVGEGQCARIFTGAMLPDGADWVILQERVTKADSERVWFEPHTPAEDYVRPVGHDVTAGAVLAQSGSQLQSFTLGTLAAAGIDRVSVYGRPSVGVFSTGDELVDAGTPAQSLRPGQIYDSNRFTLLHLLADLPCQLSDLGRLPDDRAAVMGAIAEAAQAHQLLLTSGGVSVGDADHVTSVIQELGELTFWRLNLKPGKPLAFGQIGECAIFGLPGNPVSTIVTALLVAKPAIATICGTQSPPVLRVPATLTCGLTHQPGRTEYQRGTYEMIDGSLMVGSTGDQGSNRMSSFAQANCLIEVDKSQGDLAAGAPVHILPFDGLLA